MEITYIYMLILTIILVVLGLNSLKKDNARKWAIQENMPIELEDAKLVASEQYIKTDLPRRMHGTFDQLYRLKSGVYVLIDSKTRKHRKVYRYDIVQLSVYRAILNRNGKKMAPYAYVRVVTEQGVQYLKQELLCEEEVIAEYDRVKAILSGKEAPGIVNNKRMCTGCGQQANCPAWDYKTEKADKYAS